MAASRTASGSLQANLNRLSLDFNTEIAAACRALLPESGQAAERQRRKRPSPHAMSNGKSGPATARCFATSPSQSRRGNLVLRVMDPSQVAFRTEAWPEDWAPVKKRLERIQQWQGGPGGPPPFDGSADGEDAVFQLPLLPHARPAPFGRRDPLPLFELNPPYLRISCCRSSYNATSQPAAPSITRWRSSPAALAGRIYQAGGGDPSQVGPMPTLRFACSTTPSTRSSDAARGRAQAASRNRFGRWQMYVRHRAGSLEAVVAQARWRNLAVTSGVLLLMFGTSLR